jgi:hypothetical protein
MRLVDVNVLVCAFREDAPSHDRVKPWLDALVADSALFGLADLVLSGFLRIVTHPKVFTPPTPTAEAVEFVRAMRAQPNCVVVEPGPRHFEIFLDLCERARARGNLIPDAYLAALAIESGSEWITTDADFARFPGLRWSHPMR